MNDTLSTEVDAFQRVHQAMAGLLGGPVTAFSLNYSSEQILYRETPRPRVVPLEPFPLVRNVFGRDSTQGAKVGVELHRLRLAGRTVTLAHVRGDIGHSIVDRFDDLWFVPTADAGAVYRYVRRKEGGEAQTKPPLMTETLRDRLWRNTIGFLQKGDEIVRKYGIPLKRGVMLLGSPGNGKTMAARWLRQEASKRNLCWRTVTVQEYEAARRNDAVSHLFATERPGIVFFDDFDAGLQDRNDVGRSFEHSVLLTELDGVDVAHGVVFIFTTNLKERDLDPAIRRPGRIDVFIPFDPPSAEFRETFVRSHWPAELLPHISVAEVVTLTAGLSYAELEELKKLLALHHLNHEEWNWAEAWREYQIRRGNENRRAIGFASPAAAERSGQVSTVVPAQVASLDS